MTDALLIVLLTGLGIGGWLVVVTREPVRQTLVVSIYGLVLSLTFFVVQAPDDRIQTWSTDPRSGTPGLPDLSPGAPAPACRRTVVRGRTVFDAGTL